VKEKTFYIATKLERADDHRIVAEKMASLGWRLTYDWTVHGSVQDQGPERMRQVARNERSAVLDADVVIVLLPGGRGTHSELGIALGGYRRVIVHARTEADLGDRHCAFYHLCTIVVGEFSEIYGALNDG